MTKKLLIFSVLLLASCSSSDRLDRKVDGVDGPYNSDSTATPLTMILVRSDGTYSIYPYTQK